MAWSDITARNLGAFLQIKYLDGVINQLSSNFEDWEMIEGKRDGDGRVR